MQAIKQTIQSHLTPWKFAGLMLSYWCNAECEFCYLCAGPKHTFRADADNIISWWGQLEILASREDKHVKIHLTGGEPFGNWELLINILEKARDAGLPPVEKIETNGFWATNESIVEERLKILKELDVPLIVTDADVFHQEYVPIENVRLLVEKTREILGDDAIRVRWWDVYNNYDEYAKSDPNELKLQALILGRDRLNGRAAILAAEKLTGQPAETFSDQNCRKGIIKSKHVHIDPYGNIFPGVCCGIILGNAISENIIEVFDWLDRNGTSGPVLGNLVEKGPLGLMNFAKRFGFEPLKQGYLSKCQLCYHVRSFLYHKTQCRKWLGPKECYPKKAWGVGRGG